MIFIHDGELGVEHKLVDIVNESDKNRDINYASITAKQVIRCAIFVNDHLAEVVYAGGGGSHSWWTPAGGKFFPPDVAPSGLAPGDRLVVLVDGACALRLDWIE